VVVRGWWKFFGYLAIAEKRTAEAQRTRRITQRKKKTLVVQALAPCFVDFGLAVVARGFASVAILVL